MGDSDDKLSKESQDKPNWTDSGVCVDSGLCIDIHSLPSTYDVDNPFKQDADGDTMLHLAVIQGMTDFVKYLIKEAPSSEYLDIINDEYQVCTFSLSIHHISYFFKLMSKLLNHVLLSHLSTDTSSFGYNHQTIWNNQPFSCLRCLIIHSRSQW